MSAVTPFQCGNTLASTPSSCVVSKSGPLLNEVIFSVNQLVVPSNIVQNGPIQAAEWTFTVANYQSATAANLAKGQTSAYNNYGIAFQTVRPYMNNVHYRLAIAYLVDYGYIKTTVLTNNLAGGAQYSVLPNPPYPVGSSLQWPGLPAYGGLPNFVQAWKELKLAGLVPQVDCAPGGYTTACMSTTVWDVGATFEGYSYPAATGSFVSLGTCPNFANPQCAFFPLFYYRNDDPLRMNPSIKLCTSTNDGALAVGLNLDCIGMPGKNAGANIYGPATFGINGTVTYNPATGYNDLPPNGYTCASFQPGNNCLFVTYVINGSATQAPTDVWDMYTYGWGLSAYYTWPFSFFNSVAINSNNFVNYYNRTMDWYTNNLNYATLPSNPCAFPTVNSCGVNQAASVTAGLLNQQLPYLGYFYSNELYVVEATGWTGYSNLPAYGPATETGLFYTFMNVHPTSTAYGGTFQWALHSVADQSGLNMLTHTNWVWQADIWASIYDAPLATPPKCDTTLNAFINWMTVEPTAIMGGCSVPVVNYNSMVHNLAPGFTTGTGAGWFNYQNLMNPDPSTGNWGNTIPGPNGVANVAQTIPLGQVLAFTFRTNMTWTDNVKVTPKDFTYSLYAWDFTGQSGAYTFDDGVGAGPSGLVASHIVGNTVYVYVGAVSVWNLATYDVAVIPQHIWGLSNIGRVSTPTGALDTTLPATSSATDGAYSSFCSGGSGCFLAHPAWLNYLPNTEVGSSAFYLYSYQEPPSGAGVLIANGQQKIASEFWPSSNYYRAPWQKIAALPANHHATGTWTFSNTIFQWVRTVGTGNLKTTVYKPINHAAVITGAYTQSVPSVHVYVYSKGTSGCGWGCAGSALKYSAAMTNTGTVGKWSAAIPHMTTPGQYEIVVIGTYTFQGLPRYWISFSGFTV